MRFVCEQCGEQEVCPSLLVEEYEAHEHESAEDDDETNGEGEES